MTIAGEETDYQLLKNRHILHFLHPGIDETSYHFIKNFEQSQESYPRHSAKLEIQDIQIKSNIFKGCKKIPYLQEGDAIKKVYVKNDDPL